MDFARPDGASLLPAILDPPEREALRVAGRPLSYPGLAAAATALAAGLPGGEPVAVWATPSLETCVAVVAGVLAGSIVVPVNPRSGPGEAAHVVREIAPKLVLAEPTSTPSAPLAELPRVSVEVEVDLAAVPSSEVAEPTDPEAPAFVFLTSGTTGPPKGAVLPRRAIASNLDALAGVWAWTRDDILVHSLPLFHVHGLVLGILGALRVGGSVRHTGRFDPASIARELRAGGTILFAVPTMYRDLADAAEVDDHVRGALGGARLLVSGSAALPSRDFRRIEELTGRAIAERYGLTETLMNCATRASDDPRPGWVGPPLPGVEVRLVDDRGRALPDHAEDELGEIHVRGPNVFLGYLGHDDATAAAMGADWFRTGDLGVRSADGWFRVAGRRSTDLIETGGYRVGAGEVEAALLEHPAVAEAAVTGEADQRLGERIVAWVVLRPGAALDAAELVRHVGDSLASHKRPREVRFVDALPRNAMGKVAKDALGRG